MNNGPSANSYFCQSGLVRFAARGIDSSGTTVINWQFASLQVRWGEGKVSRIFDIWFKKYGSR